jgi:hypothetical protein
MVQVGRLAFWKPVPTHPVSAPMGVVPVGPTRPSSGGSMRTDPLDAASPTSKNLKLIFLPAAPGSARIRLKVVEEASELAKIGIRS